MTWTNGVLIGFDLETTGVDPFTDRIVSAALVEYDGGTHQHRSTEWLINPGVPIPARASEVHGISTERAVAEGADPAEAIGEITDRLATLLGAGAPVVVFNAAYDLTLLEAENRRYGSPTLASRLGGQIRPVLDPMVLDKHVDRFRKGKRLLGLVAAHYGVALADAHDASADALAAAALGPAIAARHPEISLFTTEELHDHQVLWRREQQADLADWFRRSGKPELAATVSLDWPLQVH